MPTSGTKSQPVTMDFHVKANPHLQFEVNGGHDGGRRKSQSRTRSKDQALQFLSQEEQECILFFEETIDSLEEEFEEGEAHKRQEEAGSPVDVCDGPPTLASTPRSHPSTLPPFSRDTMDSNPKDQDIIDLVRPEPGPAQAKEKMFNPAMPDFQSMAVNPQSHIEMKPRREPINNFPAEYNPPLPSGSQSGSADNYGHSQYHPVGSIPTPVLIAQKIAENQGGGATNIDPSLLRRRSLDSERMPTSPDHNVKHGPPTSTKPSRFPGNISMIMGSKEHHGQSLTSVNLQDRRAQMLANLSGTAHPLEMEQPHLTSQLTARNVPTRSVSFRDPTPDKSRMEALSKLGLTRNRAMSGDRTKVPVLTSTPSPSPAPANPSPPATVSSEPVHHEPKSVSPPSEISSLDFNSYGGKSIVVHPSTAPRSDVTVSNSHDTKIQPAVLATPSDFNSYGGKSKVMTPAPGPEVRSDLPDILRSHKAVLAPAPALAPGPAKPEALPYELNSYGGKSRTMTPSSAAHSTPDVSTHCPVKTSRAPAPSPAPRPTRSQAPPSPQRKMSLPSSPEPRRRSISKPPSFRSQGITVQFSGRGATDESRREALRKLGLLKETS
ncbi:proline and serine-rich protein 2 [Osmerus eperlanus]|uniref:proline and serine-rich protein 2 n=1 Tax=Osmerus eperlanus TaxID=29151 RepID=UPI002E14B735